MRREGTLVHYGLDCRPRLGLGEKLVSGVGVPVETREVARTYFEPDAMPLLEEIRGLPHVDFELVTPARRHQLRFALRLADARADDAVGEVAREAFALIDID